MASSATIVPAADRTWILFSGGKESSRGDWPQELVGKRADVVLALPSACLSIFAVTLPKTEAALHASMINAQIEKRGLDDRHGPTLFDFRPVGPAEDGEVFSVTVVTSLPEELVLPGAAGYSTFAAVRAHPDRGASLWREHGRAILAVYAQGIPLHLQVLSSPVDAGARLASEIQLVLLGLRSQPEFEHAHPDQLTVDSGFSEEILSSLRDRLSLPVQREVGSVDAKPETREGLLPAPVRLAARRRRSARRNVAIAAIVLIVYGVIASWTWIRAKSINREVESLEHQLSIVEPDVQHIQLVEERWKQLSPAFDKNLYPIVQLSRITAALPGSGVVVTEYRTTERNIRVEGQARDVQLANRLLEDLRGMDVFAGYEWSMPNPKVERNNTAEFQIEGKPKYASTDN